MAKKKSSSVKKAESKKPKAESKKPKAESKKPVKAQDFAPQSQPEAVKKISKARAFANKVKARRLAAAERD